MKEIFFSEEQNLTTKCIFIYHEKGEKAIWLVRRLCVCVCEALHYPVPSTPWFSALIGFAAYLSHLHLKTCAPPTSNKAELGDSVGLYVTVKVAIISRKEQERRLELIHAL